MPRSLIQLNCLVLCTALITLAGCVLDPDDGGGGSSRSELVDQIIEVAAIGTFAPAYDRFADSATALLPLGARFCATRDQSNLDALRLGWRRAMLDWQSTRSVQFGPVTEGFQNLRIQSFPELADDVTPNVQLVLDGSDALDADFIEARPVPAQGLPALELLIFTPSPNTLGQFDATTAGDRRCAYVVAVSEAIGRRSLELDEAWSGPTPFTANLINAGEVDSDFSDQSEVIDEFVSSIVLLLELVADDKLDEPRGADFSSAFPERLESLRSETSLDNIEANLIAVETLYLGGTGFGFDDFLSDFLGNNDLDSRIKVGISNAKESLSLISPPLLTAISDSAERPRVDALWEDVRELRSIFEFELVPALDARILFNSNDGD